MGVGMLLAVVLGDLAEHRRLAVSAGRSVPFTKAGPEAAAVRWSGRLWWFVG